MNEILSTSQASLSSRKTKKALSIFESIGASIVYYLR
ncbi:hypothetical protein SLEP1_g37948 [Rubroshorea leprosula]|uniref:Uncharacterized protein n=1 Tax=Rubroshorea leprosula TaxID=152421 RepID=A0AAV5KWL4_9ROSI|nr:hypothetical protein SLEP1_g37948 [Rubroshorea leprosula]